MITTRNEFEPVPAFTHIAGCSLGTWTPRETACALVKTLQTVSSYDCLKLWQDIAEQSDDSEWACFDEIQDDVAELLNDYMPMPDYCSVTLEDGEFRVVPNLELAQEECKTYSDCPDDPLQNGRYAENTILLVNDHGNVTCQQWSAYDMEYKTIWDMV